LNGSLYFVKVDIFEPTYEKYCYRSELLQIKYLYFLLFFSMLFSNWRRKKMYQRIISLADGL